MSSYASDQEVENVINASKRRCRIGKVKWKRLTRPYRPVNRWPSPSRNWWDDPYRPSWAQPGSGYVNPQTYWISGGVPCS